MVQMSPPPHTHTHTPAVSGAFVMYTERRRVSLTVLEDFTSSTKEGEGRAGKARVTRTMMGPLAARTSPKLPAHGLGSDVPFVAAILPGMGGWEEGTRSFRVWKSVETD